MPAPGDKIITRLRERRQIEADLRSMLTATSEVEVRMRAQQIAAAGIAVVPTLLSNLDRADPRMIAAIGTVAAFMDQDTVIAALRAALRQTHLSRQSRTAMVTVLEQYLGEPVEDGLRPALPEAEAVALSALKAVLEQAEATPTLLAEFVQGLDHQEPDVALAVIGALEQEEATRSVEPLRLLVQDVREEIAASALRALGSLRDAQAGVALQTLIPALSPELKASSQRALRKLGFSGVQVDPLLPPSKGWRSLISPVDGVGQQRVWFIQETGSGESARFLSLVLRDGAGAVEAMGHREAPCHLLPPRRAKGTVHDLLLPDGASSLLMLEAAFDAGRGQVLEALAWNRETQIPVPPILRLLSPWLWGTSGPARAAPSLPELAEQDGALLLVSDRLVTHPAFAGWRIPGDLCLGIADQARRHPGWDRRIWAMRLASEFAGNAEARSTLHRRLTANSQWLLAAGEETWARLSLVTAQALLGEESEQSPFVQALARRDLELTLHSL